MENIPKFVSDQVIEVLHEKLFWNGFTLQDPIGNDDFVVVDGAKSDLYLYKTTMLIELVQHESGEYEILEYI